MASLKQGYIGKNAQLDEYEVQDGLLPDYTSFAYAAIRGREQFLIDSFGGAQKDVRKGIAGISGNPSRGIRTDNPARKAYVAAAILKGWDLPDFHPGGPLPKWP